MCACFLIALFRHCRIGQVLACSLHELATIEHVATLFIERRETARSNVHFELRADWLPLTAVRELSCAQCLLLFKSYIIAVAALELGVILAGYPELVLYMWVSACSIRFISPLHSYLIVLLLQLQLVQIHVVYMRSKIVLLLLKTWHLNCMCCRPTTCRYSMAIVYTDHLQYLLKLHMCVFWVGGGATDSMHSARNWGEQETPHM